MIRAFGNRSRCRSAAPRDLNTNTLFDANSRGPYAAAFLLVWVAALAMASPATAADDPGDGGAAVDYARDVRPILARACLKCHGPEKQRGGLRLDERASVIAGGDSGEPAVTPGKIDASPLLERVTTADMALRMPPAGKPLSTGEIALLRRWIAAGAPWPETDAKGPTAGARPEMRVTDADREHWAFRPLRAVEPPRCATRRPARPWTDPYSRSWSRRG